MRISIISTIITLTFFCYNNSTNAENNKGQKHNSGSTTVFNSTSDTSETQVKVMLSGTLSKPEVTSYQYGTHLLKGNILDGKPNNLRKVVNFALKSDSQNLDAFIGKKVIITGTKIAGFPIEGGPDYYLVSTIEEDKQINSQKVGVLIKDCPSEKIVNKMPTVGKDETPKEYYIYKGQRKEISDFDKEWIKKYCKVKITVAQ